MTSQAIVDYFATWDQYVDIKTIGDGTSNPQLVFLIANDLCEHLCRIMEDGFIEPKTYFARGHFWDMLTEVSLGTSDMAVKLANAMKLVEAQVQTRIKFGPSAKVDNRTNYFDLPYNEFEMRFRSLVVQLLNDGDFVALLEFLTNDTAIMTKFYTESAILRTNVKEVTDAVSAFTTLAFNIDISVPCKKKYLQTDLAPVPLFEATYDRYTSMFDEYKAKLDEEQKRFFGCQ
jgi:hypothetical protein